MARSLGAYAVVAVMVALVMALVACGSRERVVIKEVEVPGETVVVQRGKWSRRYRLRWWSRRKW